MSLNSSLDYETATVADIVINDFRCVELFRKEQIDFYCNNKISLKDVCEKHSLDFSRTVSFFKSINKLPNEVFIDYKTWDIDFIMQYIKKTHYKYIHKTFPEILEKTAKIADLHGKDNPELIELKDIIKRLSTELIEHINAEESVLLPTIDKVIQTKTQETFNEAKALLESFNDEHSIVAEALSRINVITNKYTAPANASKTYRMTYVILQHFEKQLQVHLHLENNILFPKLYEKFQS